MTATPCPNCHGECTGGVLEVVKRGVVACDHCEYTDTGDRERPCPKCGEGR